MPNCADIAVTTALGVSNVWADLALQQLGSTCLKIIVATQKHYIHVCMKGFMFTLIFTCCWADQDTRLCVVRPKKPACNPVGILTGRKKTQFSHLRSSVLP